MGLMIKKWCSADVTTTIMVTDITKDVRYITRRSRRKAKTKQQWGLLVPPVQLKSHLTRYLINLMLNLGYHDD